MLGPRSVRDLLARHGLKPNKSYGQNFVVDGNTIRRMIREAEVVTGEVVCEVGPGLGSLTIALRQAGARVVAVEIDAGLVRALRDVLGTDPGLHIVHGDALRVDFRALLEGGPAKLVANLPYNIATPVVLRALRAGVFSRLLVMVQREVGRRWAAGVGDPLYGAVSVKLQALATLRVTAKVSRAAFYPAPKVDSVTVQVLSHDWTARSNIAELFALIDQGFAQRRKRLRNALAGVARSPAKVEAALKSLDLNLNSRAEELDLATWDELAVTLRD